VAEEDKAGIYRAADVYCCPALGGESFGIVLIEAMAAGTPVVCSDLDAFKAVTGTAAELVPPGDAAALGRALRRVLTANGKAEAMRAAGRTVAGRYSWDTLVPNVESVYARARAMAQ
jgi:phosphatidylinositol alpha-mannosyltransferase